LSKRFTASTVAIIAGCLGFVNTFFSFFLFFYKGGLKRLKKHWEDRQEERPAGECVCCGGELYGWESVYVLDGDLVCPDCLEDYAKDYFAPHLWVLEEWNGRI
jgi:hypothetical protein